MLRVFHLNHDETLHERLVADSCDESAHKRIDRSEAVSSPVELLEGFV